jgi:hypothetical protein
MSYQTLTTKEDFQNAIDQAVERRSEALSEITRLTLASFSNDSIIRQALIAREAYYEMRYLKQQMRLLYPIPCTCLCAEHRKDD